MTERAETFKGIVQERMSVRAFLPQPVPQDVMDDIFGAAQHAPSNCNTQPWLVHVVSGTAIEKLREVMPAKFMAGEMSMDFPYDGVYEGVYRDRQYGAAKSLYDSLGIERAEKEKRHLSFMRNFCFFDAPHVAFVFMHEPFGIREAADVGMFAQSVMLGMVANGLGSCPQTSLSFQADLIREQLGIDSSEKLLFGMSFGYPDPDAPANSCRTDRANLPDSVQFHQ